MTTNLHHTKIFIYHKKSTQFKYWLSDVNLFSCKKLPQCFWNRIKNNYTSDTVTSLCNIPLQLYTRMPLTINSNKWHIWNDNLSLTLKIFSVD